MDGSGASERGAGGPQEEQLQRRRSPGGRPRLPAPPRPTPMPAPEADGHQAARADAAGASGDGGAAWRVLGSAASAATPRLQQTRAEYAGSGRGTTLQSPEQGPSGGSPRKPLHPSFPGCRVGSWFSEKRGELGRTAPFAPAERCKENEKIMKCPLPGRLKK